MKRFFLISMLYFAVISSGCSESLENKKQLLTKNHLDEIVLFHFDEAKANQYSIDEYLEVTKPYGIWDIRPRGVSELDIHGQIAIPGEVSHYHFGLFSAHFGIPEENIQYPLNQFLEKLAYKEAIFKENASLYKYALSSMATLIKNSGHKIYISNKHFRRVDDLYYEKNKFSYWKYDIPKSSHFHLSTKKVVLKDASFDDNDWEILNALEKLGLYGVVYQNDVAVIMIDGLLNYSYGYIVTQAEPRSIDLGPLFNLQELQKVNDDPMIYFYVSN